MHQRGIAVVLVEVIQRAHTPEGGNQRAQRVPHVLRRGGNRVELHPVAGREDHRLRRSRDALQCLSDLVRAKGQFFAHVERSGFVRHPDAEQVHHRNTPSCRLGSYDEKNETSSTQKPAIVKTATLRPRHPAKKRALSSTAKTIQATTVAISLGSHRQNKPAEELEKKAPVIRVTDS